MAEMGHGRRSSQGAPSVRSTSSTGNILSPPALQHSRFVPRAVNGQVYSIISTRRGSQRH